MKDILNNYAECRGTTDREIEKLEEYIGFKLPDNYVKFLKGSYKCIYYW